MKNKKPEIRFKGFSEEWEEKKLEDGTLKIGDGLHGTPQYVNNGGIYFINGNNLISGTISVNNETKQVSVNEQFKDNKILNTNTILMSINGTIGNLAWYQGEKVMLGKSVAYITLEDFDKTFIYAYLQTSFIQNHFMNKLTGSTIKNLGLKNIRETEVLIPTDKTEQTQIGNFFKNLDSLITLHQQKYDKLVNVKKAMLEKMFPKNGADVPEIRFKGFSAAWDGKNLGDIAEIKTGPFGSTLHAEDYVEDGEPIITTEHFKSGDLPNNKKGIPQVSNHDYSRLKSYLLKSGDIVFSRVGSVDINARIKDFQDGWLFSGRVLRVRTSESIDSEFLHQELSTTRVRNNVIMRAVGQTMPSINTQILKATQVQIPKDINEQRKIGVFFINLDKLLTLHQEELGKLKNLKKAMLEKMFV